MWENIARSLSGQPLQDYDPQQSFLKLINKGDGTAIGQWKGFAFEGSWVMRLKDRIDSQFMEKYRPQAMMADDEPMQCRGCGCKLGSIDLESALTASSDIELEDAAQLGDSDLVASTDFFTSPFQDAYLVGRIAALHSASDIICTGAAVSDALANVVLPEGDAATQAKTLRDFLAGARLEFAAMGGKVVGGHTIVGPRMEVGFTVIGKQIGSSLIRKRNLKVGDQLLSDQTDRHRHSAGSPHAQSLRRRSLRVTRQSDAEPTARDRTACHHVSCRRGHRCHRVWISRALDRNASGQRCVGDDTAKSSSAASGCRNVFAGRCGKFARAGQSSIRLAHRQFDSGATITRFSSTL